MKKRLLGILILTTILVITSIIYIYSQKTKTPQPSPVAAKTYTNPTPTTAPPRFDYTLVFVGDSFTEVLGNFDELKSYLSKYYPNKSFLLLNYGYGSTNILSVSERLLQETQHGRAFQPITNIYYDLIFIESFGHNPLSQFPLQEGLQKQNQALDGIVNIITQKQPKKKIIFIATIAPNRDNYAKKTVDLSTEKRREWADERIAYIKNHIQYANSHQIPVINIFEKSLEKNGSGKMDYINKTDNIHPSPNGVYFISQEIADFIYKNNLLGIND